MKTYERVRKLRKTASRFFLFLAALLTVFAQAGAIKVAANALPPDEVKALNQWPNWVATNCGPGAVTSDNGDGSPTSSIYMLGDSIMVGAYFDNGAPLKQAIADNGWSAKVDASGGRGMSYAGSDPRGNLPGKNKSGLDAIPADSDAIKNSDTVVIELGTNESNSDQSNSPDIFKSQMIQAINNVKNINNSAKIYWVNLFSDVTPKYTPYLKEYNQVISSVASDKGINVIDTTKANISLSSDGIHPDAKGYNTLSKTIADALGHTFEGLVGGAPAAQTEKCCASSGSGDDALAGNNNEEKTWNYFIDKGLEPKAVAGIMGNISVESGFDPQNIQDPAGRSKDPNDAGSGGWGLIQFTPGSDVFSFWAPAAHVDATKDNVYLLSTQLDIVWGYMKYSPGAGGSMLNEFKGRSTSVHSATLAFEDLVENAGIPNMTDRYSAADAAMSKYGGGGGAGGVSGPSADSGSGGAMCACPSSTDNMDKLLGDLANKNGGKTSISVSSADKSISGSANGTVQMPTRSSYKVYTAYATLRAIEAGKISWSTTVWNGKSVEETMKQMIIYSNNDAAEALRLNTTIGTPAQVTNMLQNDVGLSNKTVMGSGNASDPTGSNSQSTSDDYVKFLLLLQKNKLPGVDKPNSYDTLLGFMKQATTDGGSARDGIVAGVGGGTEVADKPGWAPAGPDQASNDVGIVYLKDNPYVIAILTDKPDQWTGVANIARSVNRAMNGSPDTGSTPGCSGVGSGDLSGTVKAYAWPTYHSAPFTDKRPDYAAAVRKAQQEGRYVGGTRFPGIDCGGFVTTAMIDSGFEPNYNYSGKLSQNAGNTIQQEAWLKDHWQRIHPQSTGDLKPGDVAINSSHTYMYVGKIPGFNSVIASASWDSRAPMAGEETPADPGFDWFRKQ